MMRRRSATHAWQTRRERYAAAAVRAKGMEQRRAPSLPFVPPLIPVTWHLSKPAGEGPPTEFAMKSMTKLYMLVVLQGIVCWLRLISLFLIPNIVGLLSAVLAAIITSLGLYVAENDMDIKCLKYYGLSNLVIGVFDLVKFFSMINDPVVQSTRPSSWIGLAVGVVLLGSLLELVGAAFSWCIYKHHIIAASGTYLPLSQKEVSPFGKGSRLWSA